MSKRINIQFNDSEIKELMRGKGDYIKSLEEDISTSKYIKEIIFKHIRGEEPI